MLTRLSNARTSAGAPSPLPNSPSAARTSSASPTRAARCWGLDGPVFTRERVGFRAYFVGHLVGREGRDRVQALADLARPNGELLG